jgi:hypothetical protein
VSAPTRVLYIGGSGRSGSTVLEALLGRIEGTAGVGELRYVWQRGLVDDQLCGCGERFRACPFWLDVFAAAFGGMDRVDLDAVGDDAAAVDRVRFVPGLTWPRLATPALRSALERHGRRLETLYAAIARVTGAPVVVDSSKDVSYAFLLAALGGLDLSLVHLVRDSRAVAHSWTRRRRRPEVHWEVAYMRQVPPAVSAREWLITNGLFELLASRMGPAALRSRYEDLAHDPDAHVAEACRLAGLEAVPRATEAVVHSVSGNPLRFQEGPLQVKVDDEWRRSLSARDRRVVTGITAPLLARYGYLGRKTS